MYKSFDTRIANEERYNCMKEITAKLKADFKGIQANTYGYCCRTDYDAKHKYINNNDYVCAQLFKGGLNNQYQYDSYLEKSQFQVPDLIFYWWHLETFNLGAVVSAMTEIATRYGYKVTMPTDDAHCIRLIFKD